MKNLPNIFLIAVLTAMSQLASAQVQNWYGTVNTKLVSAQLDAQKAAVRLRANDLTGTSERLKKSVTATGMVRKYIGKILRFPPYSDAFATAANDANASCSAAIDLENKYVSHLLLQQAAEKGKDVAGDIKAARKQLAKCRGFVKAMARLDSGSNTCCDNQCKPLCVSR